MKHLHYKEILIDGHKIYVPLNNDPKTIAATMLDVLEKSQHEFNKTMAETKLVVEECAKELDELRKRPF